MIFVYSWSCAAKTAVNLRTFLSPQKETPHPLVVTPHSPPLFSPTPTYILINQ